MSTVEIFVYLVYFIILVVGLALLVNSLQEPKKEELQLDQFTEAFLVSLSFEDQLLDEILMKILEQRLSNEAIGIEGDYFERNNLTHLRHLVLDRAMCNLSFVKVRVIFLTKGWCDTWQSRIKRLHENSQAFYVPKSGKETYVLSDGPFEAGKETSYTVDFDKGHHEIEITGVPDFDSYRYLSQVLEDAHVTVLITKKLNGKKINPPKEKNRVRGFVSNIVPVS